MRCTNCGRDIKKEQMKFMLFIKESYIPESWITICDKCYRPNLEENTQSYTVFKEVER